MLAHSNDKMAVPNQLGKEKPSIVSNHYLHTTMIRWLFFTNLRKMTLLLQKKVFGLYLAPHLPPICCTILSTWNVFRNRPQNLKCFSMYFQHLFCGDAFGANLSKELFPLLADYGVSVKMQNYYSTLHFIFCVFPFPNKAPLPKRPIDSPSDVWEICHLESDRKQQKRWNYITSLWSSTPPS